MLVLVFSAPSGRLDYSSFFVSPNCLRMFSPVFLPFRKRACCGPCVHHDVTAMHYLLLLCSVHKQRRISAVS